MPDKNVVVSDSYGENDDYPEILDQLSLGSPLKKIGGGKGVKVGNSLQAPSAI